MSRARLFLPRGYSEDDADALGEVLTLREIRTASKTTGACASIAVTSASVAAVSPLLLGGHRVLIDA